MMYFFISPSIHESNWFAKIPYNHDLNYNIPIENVFIECQVCLQCFIIFSEKEKKHKLLLRNYRVLKATERSELVQQDPDLQSFQLV